MTKKYFGTDGIRGAINSENINGDMFFKFGLACGTYFKSQKKRNPFVISLWRIFKNISKFCKYGFMYGFKYNWFK